jgi:hypothetical protein
MTPNPKAFISYSWSSQEHEKWVLDLATQLRENGVDVTIDKWDLKEGHDAIKFMEKMVTDPEIKKVIIVLDRTYADKADGRKGGVEPRPRLFLRRFTQKLNRTSSSLWPLKPMTRESHFFRHSTNPESTLI